MYMHRSLLVFQCILFPVAMTAIKTKSQPTSGVQVDCDHVGLRLDPGVVPASVRVLAPGLSVTDVEALIVHGGGVHPQSVADGRQAVDADLAAVGVDLGDAVMHQRRYQPRLSLLGLAPWAEVRGRALVLRRERPPQPLHQRLGGARGCDGGVADEGDGVASFQQGAAREPGHSRNQHVYGGKRAGGQWQHLV